MSQTCNIVVGLRPEPDFANRWGLYLINEDRWLAVVFGSTKEAEEALRVLNGAGKRSRS